MSQLKLSGDASGTGVVTIASPNTNSTYTVTLPAAAGTLVNDTGGQTVQFALGSASTPSVTFTGDTNTGVFSSGADTVNFATGGAEAARINSSGTLILKGGSTSATGVGITFPADTTTTVSSNANTLDDYEEGTWTPTVYGSTTNGTYTPSSNGVYVKIGKQVTCLADFTFSAATGGAGNVRIAGLPFNYFQSCAGLFSTVSVDTTSASALNMVLSTAGSPPSAVLYPTLCIDNGALEQIPITGVTTSSRFSIAFTYFIS